MSRMFSKSSSPCSCPFWFSFSSLFILKYLCFFQITQWLKGSLTLNPQPDYHIGLSRVNGTFVWESGHQLSADVAAHWGGGQPNNVGGNENCGVVSNQSGQEELWDRDCANKQSFLCQRRLESGKENQSLNTIK